jgi:hypothetical protein
MGSSTSAKLRLILNGVQPAGMSQEVISLIQPGVSLATVLDQLLLPSRHQKLAMQVGALRLFLLVPNMKLEIRCLLDQAPGAQLSTNVLHLPMMYTVTSMSQEIH